MDNVELRDRTQDFAMRIIGVYRALPRTEEARVMGRQLLRSGTSVGANYSSARRGRSHAEFVAKLGIVLEEADETVYWLELIERAELLPAQRMADLIKEANELVAIFVSSLRTAKAPTSAI